MMSPHSPSFAEPSFLQESSLSINPKVTQQASNGRHIFSMIEKPYTLKDGWSFSGTIFDKKGLQSNLSASPLDHVIYRLEQIVMIDACCLGKTQLLVLSASQGIKDLHTAKIALKSLPTSLAHDQAEGQGRGDSDLPCPP